MVLSYLGYDGFELPGVWWIAGSKMGYLGYDRVTWSICYLENDRFGVFHIDFFTIIFSFALKSKINPTWMTSTTKEIKEICKLEDFIKEIYVKEMQRASAEIRISKDQETSGSIIIVLSIIIKWIKLYRVYITWAHASFVTTFESWSSASRHMLQPSSSKAMLFISMKMLFFKVNIRTDGAEKAWANLDRLCSSVLETKEMNQNQRTYNSGNIKRSKK